MEGPDTALTFDDVLLVPAKSSVVPAEVDISTVLRREDGFTLRSPLLSAAMDTVTGADMAIEVAQAGGLGAVHKNQPPAAQAEAVSSVKRFESGMVRDPACVGPDMTVADAWRIKSERGYSGLPVVDGKGVVEGIVTNRDLRFEKRPSRPIREVMTPRGRLVTVRPGTGPEKARDLMHRHRIERVIVEDSRRRLRGLITVKDLILAEANPDACKDPDGRLRVAAAVGVADGERADALVDAGADALVVDTAHGHSDGVVGWTAKLRRRHRSVLLVSGNVATAAGAAALAKAGADVIKVGVGPGSICTTRIVAGVGVPQVSAIEAAVRGAGRAKGRPTVIADGGIRYSGDVAKALAAGAAAVMVGNILAGTDEAPGETEHFQGRVYKSYRGMGSYGAMRAGSADRYFQGDGREPAKLVPEGVEGRVPYKGRVRPILEQLLGGLRQAMGYVGAKDLAALRRAERVRVTAAGVRESHVHDIQVTKEAPNYRID